MTGSIKTSIPKDATHGQLNDLEEGMYICAKAIGGLKIEFKQGTDMGWAYHETIIHGSIEKIREMQGALKGILETQRAITR